MEDNNVEFQESQMPREVGGKLLFVTTRPGGR